MKRKKKRYWFVTFEYIFRANDPYPSKRHDVTTDHPALYVNYFRKQYGGTANLLYWKEISKEDYDMFCENAQ